MKKRESETMKPLMVRVKDKHRQMVKKMATRLDISEAKVIRQAIEEKFYKDV